MRLGSWLLVLLALVLAGSPAHAALKKYSLNNVSISGGPNSAPNPDKVHFPNPNPPPGSVALIDPVPVNPRLVKLVDTGNVTTTILVPGLSVSIFLSNNSREGPQVQKFLYDQHGGPIFTGTGSTNGGSTISWGVVTGWTSTGNNWCNSSPAVICTLADRQDQETTDFPAQSEFYDLGTWYFHSTGWTSTPFIAQYFPTDFGNNQYWYRGSLRTDATVPALEILGLGLLGASLATSGAIAMRRRSKR